MLVQVVSGGRLVYDCPPLSDVRAYCAAEQVTLWDEVTRFENPHNYYVDLSLPLWTLKNRMLLGR